MNRVRAAAAPVTKVNLKEFEPRSTATGGAGNGLGAAAALPSAMDNTTPQSPPPPATVTLQDAIQPHDFEVGFNRKDQDRIRHFQRTATAPSKRSPSLANNSGGQPQQGVSSKMVRVGLTTGEAALLAATDTVARKKKLSFAHQRRASKTDNRNTSSPPEVHLSLLSAEQQPLEGEGNEVEGNGNDVLSSSSSSSTSQDTTEEGGDSGPLGDDHQGGGDVEDVLLSPPRKPTSIFHPSEYSLFDRLKGPAIQTGGNAVSTVEVGPTMSTADVDDVIEHVLFSTDLLKQNMFTLLDLYTTDTEERHAVEEFSRRWKGVLEFDATKDALRQIEQIQVQTDHQNNKARRKSKQAAKASFAKQVLSTSGSASTSRPTSATGRSIPPPPSSPQQQQQDLETSSLSWSRHKERFDFLSKMRSIVHSAFLYAFQEVCLRHQERNQHTVSHKSLYQVVERSMDVENEAMKLVQNNKLLQSKLDGAEGEIVNLKASKAQSLKEYLKELQQVRQRLEEVQRIHGDHDTMVPRLLSSVERGGGGASSPLGMSESSVLMHRSSRGDSGFPKAASMMGGSMSGIVGGAESSELSVEDRHLKFLNRKLTVECAVLNHSLSQRANTIKALENELEATNATFSKCRHELAKALDEQENVDSTLAEAVDMASSLTDLRKRTTDLERECTQKKETILDLTQQLQQQRDDFASLESTHSYTIKVHEAEVEQLQETINEGTKYVVADFNEKIIDIHERHAVVLSDLKKEVGTLRAELEAKEDARFKLQSDVGAYHLQLDDMHNELSKVSMQLATSNAYLVSQQSNFELTLADKNMSIAEYEGLLKEAEEHHLQQQEGSTLPGGDKPKGWSPQRARPASADGVGGRGGRTMSSPLAAYRKASAAAAQGGGGLVDHTRDRESYAEAKVAVVASKLKEEALLHQSALDAFTAAKREWEAQRQSLEVDVDHKHKIIEALQHYIGMAETKLKKDAELFEEKEKSLREKLEQAAAAAAAAAAQEKITNAITVTSDPEDTPRSNNIPRSGSSSPSPRSLKGDDVAMAQQELRSLTESIGNSSRNLKAKIREEADEDIKVIRTKSIMQKRNSIVDVSPSVAATNAVNARRKSSAMLFSQGFVAFPSPEAQMDLVPPVEIVDTRDRSLSLGVVGIGMASRSASMHSHLGAPEDSFNNSSTSCILSPLGATKRGSASRPASANDPVRQNSAIQLHPAVQPAVPFNREALMGKDRHGAFDALQEWASKHHDQLPASIHSALTEALGQVEKRNNEMDGMEAQIGSQRSAMEELLLERERRDGDEEGTSFRHLEHRLAVDLRASGVAVVDNGNEDGEGLGAIIGHRMDGRGRCGKGVGRPVIHNHHHSSTTTNTTNTTTQHATIVLLDDAQASAYQAAARSMRAIRDLHIQRQMVEGDVGGEDNHHRQLSYLSSAESASAPPLSVLSSSSLEAVFPGLESAAEHFDLFQSALQLHTHLQQLIDVSKELMTNDSKDGRSSRLGVFRSLEATVLRLQNRLSKKKEVILVKRQDGLESVLGSTQAISRGVSTPTATATTMEEDVDARSKLRGGSSSQHLGVRTFGSNTPVPRGSRPMGSSLYAPTAIIMGAGGTSGVVATTTSSSGGTAPPRANPLVNRVPLQTSQFELLQGTQLQQPRPQPIVASTSIISRPPTPATTSTINHRHNNTSSEEGLGVLHGTSMGAASSSAMVGHHDTSSGSAAAASMTTMAALSDNNISPIRHQEEGSFTTATNRSLISRPTVVSTRVSRPSTATQHQGGSTTTKGRLGGGVVPRPSSSVGYRGVKYL